MGLINGQDIKDGFKPVLNPVYQMLVDGNNLINFSIKCYEGDSIDEYVLNSSLNPEVYFISKKNGVFGRLFKPQSYFQKKAVRQ
jgi:hypothetical protein